jgi:hypothetical protein
MSSRSVATLFFRRVVEILQTESQRFAVATARARRLQRSIEFAQLRGLDCSKEKLQHSRLLRAADACRSLCCDLLPLLAEAAAEAEAVWQRGIEPRPGGYRELIQIARDAEAILHAA